jgi:flagellar biosynthetic protein FliP
MVAGRRGRDSRARREPIREEDSAFVTPPVPDPDETARPSHGLMRCIAWPCGLVGLCGLAILIAFFAGFLGASPAAAQTLTLDLGQGTGVTQRALQLVALITVLSLAPSILVMVTSFTRIVVVLSLLRAALGTQTAPPNAVIVGLALFLTAFVMAPVFQRAYDTGVQPLLAGQIEAQEAFNRAVVPFREFMLRHVREKDLQLFLDLSRQPPPATGADVSLNVLVPAFMISELRRAFEIGFMIFLPFLIIDLVVASILMSVGMMMLPPVTVALPFKLIFFVLVDGWSLIAGSLVQSYGT